MIGYNVLPDPAGLGRVFYRAENLTDADAYGIETEIEHRHEQFSLSGWYAFADIVIDTSGSTMRSYAPAKHKAGLTWRYFFDKNWTFNTNYRYQTTTESLDPFTRASARHRADVTVSRKIANGQGELMVGVIDLFNKTEGPYASVGQISAYEIPGRTFFARLQMYF